MGPHDHRDTFATRTADMTDAPLHVLMLLDCAYPPPLGGGTQMQVRTLARALRARGHRVTVLAIARDAFEKRAARVDGVPVCRLRAPSVYLLGGLIIQLRLIAFLLSRRNRYDAWHAHFPHTLAAVASLLGRRIGKANVVVKVASAVELDHGTLARHPSLRGRATYLGLRQADAWQAISHRIAHGLEARGIVRNRIAAIPNAVDTARFRAIRRVPAGHPRFLFIGRLVPVKNLESLLHAFSALLVVHPDARLVIAGGGPLETSLKQCASDLGMSTSVAFTGHRDDIETLLAHADFGVLPSHFEGLSNTLLEFMASGLPMIASRVSGNEDLVCPGENGWLFDPADRERLTACLIEAAAMPAERRHAMGCNARDTVERHAGVESVLARLLALYRGSAADAALASLPLRELA